MWILLSLSAHKIYGTKGIGVLVRPCGDRIDSDDRLGTTGKLAARPGLENVPGIAGLGAAMNFSSANIAPMSASVCSGEEISDRRACRRSVEL